MTWHPPAAELLRSACGLTGLEHRKAMGWWKMLRSGGEDRAPVSDTDIAAAIRGLPLHMRVDKPWRPYKMFKRDNMGLFGEAASAWYRSQARKPQRIEEHPLIKAARELGAE